MSRRPRSESQFGSDSFLDVVANIVGILIILIVIAGLRVSQSPAIWNRTDAAATQELAEDDLPLAPETAADDPAPPALLGDRETSAGEASSNLSTASEELTAEVDRLERQYLAVKDQASANRETEAELQQRLAKLREQTESREQQAKTLAESTQLQFTNRKQLEATLVSLREQLEVEQSKPAPARKLEHHVTPMSKTIAGSEQHYRLNGNRVSEVPVLILTQRVRDQIERRKEWLLKQRSHQGEVGPVEGYSLFYQVVRDNLGVSDELRYGAGFVRISVSNWRIEPQRDLVTESAEEALRPGSRFYESLLAADEGTSITFWVYPDSYEAYRKLQVFAHDQGFLVAGRPLPHGVFISGSPNGSKSAGQ
ncbi:MAG: hypothetical protein U0872_16700 [Planctomycetaceae bacterium]